MPTNRRYYPAFLRLVDRNAVVIGGGTVAQGKVDGLLRAGAEVTVVAPLVTAPLKARADAGEMSWVSRAYTSGDLSGAFLAIVATDDAALNESVALEARMRGVLVNVVDSPDLCDFIAPAIVDRDGLTIAVSTQGASPAFAKRVREEIERLFPEEYGTLLKISADVRQTIRREGLVAPADVWQTALSPDILELVKRGELQGARQTLLDRIHAGSKKR